LLCHRCLRRSSKARCSRCWRQPSSPATHTQLYIPHISLLCHRSSLFLSEDPQTTHMLLPSIP
jgi:predicted amidophosphoribosyltransferase